MPPRPATGVVNLPLAYLALLYPVASYFTSGMETPLVQIAAAAFALHVFAPHCPVAQVLIGLAPLVRHELALPLVLTLAWDWIRARRFPWLPFAVAALSVNEVKLNRVAVHLRARRAVEKKLVPVRCRVVGRSAKFEVGIERRDRGCMIDERDR